MMMKETISALDIITDMALFGGFGCTVLVAVLILPKVLVLIRQMVCDRNMSVFHKPCVLLH